MIKERERCSVCRAKIKATKITFTQELAGSYYIVTDVPAQVCSQCSEQYLSPETVDELQESIERGEAKAQAPEKTIQVPVYQFREAGTP